MQYKGSLAHLAAYNAITISLFGLIASAGLMGGNWPYLFITSLAVMLPVLLLVTLVLAWTNRFAFDDEGGAFRKPGGKRIPYDRVRSVHIAERGGVVDVFVQQGRMHRVSLVEAVPGEIAQRLREELVTRFPGRVHARGRWAAFAPVAALLAVLLLVLGGLHAYLYHRYPQLNVRIRPLERLEKGAQRSLPPLEYAESFGFTPPKGYRYIGEEDGEQYFEDRATKQRLKVSANYVRRIFEEPAFPFRRVMGVDDYAELMSLAYRSRFGAIPLFLRASDLAGLEDVVLYEIGAPLRGFVKQGRQGADETTHIVLVGQRADQEIHFFFSGPKRLSLPALRSFVSGVQLIRPSGGGA